MEFKLLMNTEIAINENFRFKSPKLVMYPADRCENANNYDKDKFQAELSFITLRGRGLTADLYHCYLHTMLKTEFCMIRPGDCKTFFMLNSIEHEILTAHKYCNSQNLCNFQT